MTRYANAVLLAAMLLLSACQLPQPFQPPEFACKWKAGALSTSEYANEWVLTLSLVKVDCE